ncbi:MAG: hypothetical protein WBA33_13685 [Rhodanobacter lindaniclasticus]
MTSLPWRAAGWWLALLAVGLGATALRFGLIESSAIGQLCGSGHGPAWCTLRTWLVLGFLHHVYGSLALVALLPAWLRRRPSLAWLAAALGVFAMQLYGAEAGALALLLGSLRLLRLQADARAPRTPHRPGEQQVQHQP